MRGKASLFEAIHPDGRSEARNSQQLLQWQRHQLHLLLPKLRHCFPKGTMHSLHGTIPRRPDATNPSGQCGDGDRTVVMRWRLTGSTRCNPALPEFDKMVASKAKSGAQP
jgi:hypothetical protein